MPKFNDLSGFNANPLTPFLLVFRSSLAVVLSRAGRKQYVSPCTLTYSPWLSSICESLPHCAEGSDARALVEDSKGRTYAYDNLFGMRYDTTGADSLDAVQRDMPQSTDDDDGPTTIAQTVTEEVLDDVCPEGYKYDSEKKQCVIDPFQQPFADAPVYGGPVAPPGQQPAGLSPYTQIGPITLPQLRPTRVATVPQQQHGGLGALAPILPGTSRVS